MSYIGQIRRDAIRVAATAPTIRPAPPATAARQPMLTPFTTVAVRPAAKLPPRRRARGRAAPAAPPRRPSKHDPFAPKEAPFWRAGRRTGPAVWRSPKELGQLVSRPTASTTAIFIVFGSLLAVAALWNWAVR